jgi:hypothetical protein
MPLSSRAASGRSSASFEQPALSRYLLVEGSDIARFRPVKGISTSSARALLKRFGSIAAVVRRAC